MSQPAADSKAIIETRLAHEVHRRATSLLAEAAARPDAPIGSLAELRDFLVATLRHHHESEDETLWPLITAAAPETAAALADLSREHGELDAALDALGDARLAGDADREALARAAAAVRDVVHRHLDQEEPVLLPALRAHVSEEAWAAFSSQVIATSPPEGAHLMIGFLDEAGSPAEVAVVLEGLPPPARDLVSAMREQARSTIASLRSPG